MCVVRLLQVRLMHSQQLHSLQLAFESRLGILNEFWKSQMRHERGEHARTAPQAQLAAAVAARQTGASGAAAAPVGEQHMPRIPHARRIPYLTIHVEGRAGCACVTYPGSSSNPTCLV